MTECTKCGSIFTLTPAQAAGRSRVCKACIREKTKARYDARKAAGLKVSGAPCSREYHREYDKSYRNRDDVKQRLREKARERTRNPVEAPKIKARRMLRTAIEAGHIAKSPCEVCGACPADAHHDDYAKPLEVRWLCRVHHRAHHLQARNTPALHVEVL